jgi:hypothetical protein
MISARHKTLWTSLFLSAFTLAPASLLMGQSPAPTATPSSTKPQVSFQFDRPGLAVPHFILTVREDGTGTYEADEARVTAPVGSAVSPPPKHIDRPLTLSPSTTSMIFKDARSLNFFNNECASKAKNIADTGKKTLTYSGSDGNGTCTYNFSENKNVVALTETFQAIAFTIDEGRKLEYLHRYDRLGLDAEMDALIHEYEAKRALELGTISPTLTSLTEDMAVMQRVRVRAARLLEQTSDSK